MTTCTYMLGWPSDALAVEEMGSGARAATVWNYSRL